MNSKETIHDEYQRYENFMDVGVGISRNLDDDVVVHGTSGSALVNYNAKYDNKNNGFEKLGRT